MLWELASSTRQNSRKNWFLCSPPAQQQLGERSNSLEALAAEATLRLCHPGSLQIFVREIADEVNRIQTSRGETLKFTAEKVGHKFKKADSILGVWAAPAMDC
jgi:hypothetical protein